MRNCDNTQCGKEFVPKKVWQRFCSIECQRGYWTGIYKSARQIVEEARQQKASVAGG